MGDGVSKNLDFGGVLDRFRSGLQAMRGELGTPVEVPVKVTGLDAARSEITDTLQPGAIGDGRMSPDRAPGVTPHPAEIMDTMQPDLSAEQRFGLSPSATRHRRANWDGPEDYPNTSPNRLSEMAESGWAKTRQGGAYHTLMTAGTFGRKWGSLLGEESSREQRSYSDAAATPQGRKIAESMETMEKLGKKVAELNKDLAGGGAGGRKAADELEKVQKALDEVAKSGKNAADALGGEMGAKLRGEMEAVEKNARAGSGGGGEPSGPGYFTPGKVMGLATNPTGALQGMGMDAGTGALGMLGPGALALLGSIGVVAAASYASFKYVQGKDKEVETDSEESTDDWALSRRLGNKFDFRGEYWENRTNSRKGVDSDGARRVLGSMGIGLDNFEGDISGRLTKDGMGLTEKVLQDSTRAGVRAEEWSSLFGASVKSGATQASTSGYDQFNSVTLGFLSKMAESGVDSNSSLHSLTSLAERQVAALGRMSDGDMRFFSHMLGEMAATGDPEFKNRGAEVLGKMGAPKTGNAFPIVFGGLSGNKDKQMSLMHRFYPERDWKDIENMNEFDRLMLFNENVSINAEKTGEALKGDKFKNTPLTVAGNLLGVKENPLTLKRYRDLDFGESASDRRTSEEPLGWKLGPRGDLGMFGVEQSVNRTNAIGVSNAQDAKNTGYTDTLVRGLTTSFDNWVLSMTSNSDSMRRSADSLDQISRQLSSKGARN